MKATLGGRDAQSVESTKTIYPYFKIANNSFKIIKRLVLELGREKKFSLCLYLWRNYILSMTVEILIFKNRKE